MINCIFTHSMGQSAGKQMKFQIVCDSSADLPGTFAEENGVSVVPYYISMDDEHYFREGVELSIPEFYQAMIDRSDCFPKTSMPTIADTWTPFCPMSGRGFRYCASA